MPGVVLAGEAELTDLLKTLTGDGGVDGEDEGSEQREENEREEVVNLSDSGASADEEVMVMSGGGVMVLSDKASEEVDAAVQEEVLTLASHDFFCQLGAHDPPTTPHLPLAPSSNSVPSHFARID